MPVVATLFEFFLLLQFGNCVATDSEPCRAGASHTVRTGSHHHFERCERFIRFLTHTLCPPCVTLDRMLHQLATVCLTCVLVCDALCAVVLCYAVVCLCVCVVVYVCFVLFCRYFGNLFGINNRKVKVYAAFLRCHFLDFFGVFVL